MLTISRFALLLLAILLAGCATQTATPEPPQATIQVPPSATPLPSPTPADEPLGAGFRFSTYGVRRNPGPDYWLSVGERMSAKFPGARPETIWIIGNFMGQGMTYLSFPAENKDKHIKFTYVDMNEATFKRFDEQGVKVWLQVEPGDADMLTLIDLTLEQYKHHPCIIGFGVDVEWFKSDGSAEGTPVTNAEAEAWVKAIRAHNPNYRLFLKHWDENWMPPTYRDGVVFINDSQQLESLDQLVDEFAAWGKRFAPAKVGFQYGYPADRPWWKNLQDPAKEIGEAILAKTPNTTSLFWVDFTVLEVFPEE